MKQIKVKAVPGKCFPRMDVPTRFVPPQGLVVPRHSYYLRGIARGDIELVKPPKGGKE